MKRLSRDSGHDRLLEQTSSARYKKLTSGTCARITTMAECAIAATKLGMSDRTVSDDGQSGTRTVDPPFCYVESGSLKFNKGSNSVTPLSWPAAES